MFAEGGDALPNLFGLGIGGAVLWLGYRLLTRQSDSWSGLVDSARKDAAEARLIALQANERAHRSEEAEADCKKQLAELWAEIRRLRGEEDN